MFRLLSLLKSNNLDLSLHFNVLIDYVDGRYEAHCLELDLVSDGKGRGKAVQNLLDCIMAQINACADNDNLANLFNPAPKEYWDKLS